MSREILYYGRIFYGHRLGRYFCPDDLSTARVKKTGASGSRFLLVLFLASPLFEAFPG
jgi:hypothetical protein